MCVGKIAGGMVFNIRELEGIGSLSRAQIGKIGYLEGGQDMTFYVWRIAQYSSQPSSHVLNGIKPASCHDLNQSILVVVVLTS